MNIPRLIIAIVLMVAGTIAWQFARTTDAKAFSGIFIIAGLLMFIINSFIPDH